VLPVHNTGARPRPCPAFSWSHDRVDVRSSPPSPSAWLECSPRSCSQDVQIQDVALRQELAAHTRAWRRFPRLEASAGSMVARFGEQTMEDYWDVLAGDARVRHQSSVMFD